MQTLSFQQLDQFAATVAQKLSQAPSFCLWLSGDLGAGKTTLTGHILRAMGLNQKIPVTSPTFTYFNDYQIGDKWYGHMDLYRAGDDFPLEELGITDRQKFTGFFVEWPEQIPANPILDPTHEISLVLTDDPLVRSVEFQVK